jgi:hypothetical protein
MLYTYSNTGIKTFKLFVLLTLFVSTLHAIMQHCHAFCVHKILLIIKRNEKKSIVSLSGSLLISEFSESELWGILRGRFQIAVTRMVFSELLKFDSEFCTEFLACCVVDVNKQFNHVCVLSVFLLNSLKYKIYINFINNK